MGLFMDIMYESTGNTLKLDAILLYKKKKPGLSTRFQQIAKFC
jgi:hypothetical protein